MKKVPLHINKNNSGFSLVEILVALSVFLTFVTVILNLNINTDRQLKRVTNIDRATALAEEGLEATRNIRDDDFSYLVDGTYGLIASGTEWILNGSSDTNDIFEREITVSTINPNQKQIDSTVSWDDKVSLNNKVTLNTYLTNWQSFVPPAGFTLKKIIVNYFSDKGLNDFIDYKVTTTVGTTTVETLLDHTTAVESPTDTFTFETVDLSPGNYTVSETVDPNYTQTFSGDCDTNGVVSLASLDSKLCTITNEEKYATLTVIKNVVNNGGSKTIADFAPYKYGTTEIVQNVATKVPPNSYTITETTDSEYTATFSGDCDSGGLISLILGDNKTCTITNTQASWDNPNTLQGTLDIAGIEDGRKVFVLGNYAYIVRAGGIPDFAIVDISNPSSPSLTGSLTLNGIPSNIFVSGNYAYVSSDDNAQELQIINISNPASPTLAGTYNAVANNNANTVFVSGNYAYLGRSNTGLEQDFLIINISNPASPTLTGTLNTAASSYEIVVVGNYAYIASGDNIGELKIVNVSNPASPTVVGGYDASSNTDAITVAVDGNFAYIGQGSNFHKINITNQLAPTLSGTYAVGGTVNDISIWSGAQYAFLATANASAELRVVNINPATPTLIGDYNNTATFNGTAYDSARNRAIMVGTDNTGELRIIRP